MTLPLLYQFSFSHFCEKARWALDYRGRPYAYRNLVPGFHARVTTAIAPDSHVPILVEDDTVVQGSDAIVDHVDGDGQAPLTPADPLLAGEAARWEQFAAEQIGVPLRLWFYFHLLPDADAAIAFLTRETDDQQRDALARAYPKVRAAMCIRMNINADSAASARETLLGALDTLDATLAERDYLAGTAFSRADLSVAALLWTYCRSGTEAELAAQLPAAILEQRANDEGRRSFEWVRELYATRRPAPCGSAAPPEQRAAQ